MAAKKATAKSRTTKKSTQSNDLKGWSMFAGLMLALVGLLHGMIGLVALFKDEVFVAAGADVWVLNYNQWGWIHIVGGLIALAAAAMLIKNHNRANRTAVAVALASTAVAVVFMPIYSLWATALVAANIVVLYSVMIRSDK